MARIHTEFDLEGELRINGERLGTWAVNGITQQLGQIQEGGKRRPDWNGRAKELRRPELEKYKSVIAGRGALPPVVQRLWRGADAVVDCIYPVCAGRGLVMPADFGRPYVAGSIFYIGNDGPLPRNFGNGDGAITGDPGLINTTYYLPHLKMYVEEPVDGTYDYDQANTPWQLTLTEVEVPVGGF